MSRIVTRVGAVIAVLLGLVALAAGAWWWHAVYGDVSHPAQPAQVVVERGSSFGDVERRLADAGVIADPLAFRLLVRLRHEDADVRAGEYRFPPHETEDQVLHALLSGGAEVARWVAVPEGFTAKQIAERLQNEGFGPAEAFEDAFSSSSIDVGGTKTRSLEGFLFPSTYLVPTDATPAQVAKIMTDEFLSKLPRDAAARARGLHVTVPAAVTVASMVEREAKVEADRPLIAGVIYNRLKLDMPLEIDATIEYALPEHQTEITRSDLAMDSPYNTYLHAGLPPTPIANPGLPSVEAALRPAKTDALYYVYCGGGRHVFARTLAEHQANVARCLK